MSVELLNPARLEEFMRAPESELRRIFLVGSSGAGKSTLWKSLRLAVGDPVTAFPMRFISRTSRPEDGSENVWLPKSEFPAAFQSGKIDFYWPKFLPEQTEFYGFPPCSGKNAIYSCNNEFIINHSDLMSRGDDILNRGLVVQVRCSAEVRRERLTTRYSATAIGTPEFEYRLRGGDGDMREEIDISIFNDRSTVGEDTHGLLDLLKLPSPDYS